MKICRWPEVQHARQELRTARKDFPVEEICRDHQFEFFEASRLRKSTIRKYTLVINQTHKMILALWVVNVQKKLFQVEEIEWPKAWSLLEGKKTCSTEVDEITFRRFTLKWVLKS